MVDVAKLSLSFQSDQVGKARTELKGFKKDAGGAATGATSFAAAGKGVTTSMQGMLATLGPLAAGLVTVSAVMSSIGKSRDFNASLAEASTLLEGTTEEMNFLAKSARELSKEFGGDATTQVQGFYQAISAGAGGAAEAVTLLDTANRFAIGGVTDTVTAVDALTTATNAYVATGLTAVEASDALFVGIKAGKTTADELGASLGQVVPIASAMGVSFDEVVGSVAALTTQGQSTAQATTGLRQVLVSVIKPSKEAADTAKALGLEFTAQALEAKGLAGFLADVTEKTGGNQDAMAKLFGSVEALNAALAFAGGAGEVMANVMEDMGNKAGATQTAFQKVAEGLDQRLNVQIAKLTDGMLTFGNLVLQVAVPAMELITENAEIATAAFVALGVAVAVAGGPFTLVVAAAAAAAVTFGLIKKPSKDVADSMFDATAGTLALNEKLMQFNDTFAPAAGKSAIELANSNVKLADSAFEAAGANLALLRTELQLTENRVANQPGNLMGASELKIVRQDEVAAVLELQAAEEALATARANRKSAVTTVAGADFEATGDREDLPGVKSVAQILAELGLDDTANGAVTDGFANRLEVLLGSLATEREVLDEWYAESLETLEDRRADELLTEEEHALAKLRVEEQYQSQKSALIAAGNKNDLDSIVTGGIQILNAVGQFNAKALKVAKIAAAGQALVSTLQGAAKELEKGVFGFATAAAVIAQGATFIAAIKSGGSASVSGGGGSGASAPTAPPTASDTVTGTAPKTAPVPITLQNITPQSLFTGQMLIDLSDSLRKEYGDQGFYFANLKT